MKESLPSGTQRRGSKQEIWKKTVSSYFPEAQEIPHKPIITTNGHNLANDKDFFFFVALRIEPRASVLSYIPSPLIIIVFYFETGYY